MSEKHIAICLSSSLLDVTEVAWPGKPQVFVRFDLHATLPAEIDGIPVESVYDIVPASLKDFAYFEAVHWHGQASRLRGANGEALGHTMSPLGIPLWWMVDLLLHDTVWLWIRAVETVHAVLARYRPTRVSVWGTDSKLPWMRTTVMSVLAQQSGLQVVEVAPADDGSRARARWRASGAELLATWDGHREPTPFFRMQAGTNSRASTRNGTLHVVTLADSCWMYRGLEEEVSVVDVNLRRLSGPDDVIGFDFDNGRHKQTVTVGPHGVRLATGGFHAHPATEMTRYTLELNHGQSLLYVNNKLVLADKALPGAAPDLYWGHLKPVGDCESEWASISWGRRIDAVPQRSGLLARMATLFTRQSRRSFFFEEERIKLASLLGVKESVPVEPRDGGTLPPRDAIVLLSFGDELRWYDEHGKRTVYDQFSDGILEAFPRGTPLVRLTLNHISGRIPPEVREAADIIELRHWHPQQQAEDEVRRRLFEVWWAWRGDGTSIVRFPDYRGVSIDAHLAQILEETLPYLVSKAPDAHALDTFCQEYRPRAVIFTHFVSSQRHLIAAATRSGALTVGPAVGCDSQDHLFYGLRDPDSGCPRADLYTLWGEREKAALENRGPLNLPLVASGRTRQDAFARCQRMPANRGWLQDAGLPQEARGVVVFGDVLCSTNGAQILTHASCEALLRGIVAAVSSRPDIHVVYKPWRGDDLNEVRTVVGRIDHPRLHVIDPDMLPFHNVDLLQYAVAVVSSPTSMLAEFAAMKAIPIVLSLPETVYYHGEIIGGLFEDFSIVVRQVDEIEAAVRKAIAMNEGGMNSLNENQRLAVARAFGDMDGRNADRLANEILARIGPDLGRHLRPST